MEKIKNMPVFRFLAFFVSLAIILGILSFFAVSASAEIINGTISNYSCIKFSYDDWISIRTIYDDFNNFSDDYIYGFVYYESNGSLVSFTNSNISYTKGTNSLVFCGNTFYPSWLDKEVYSNSSYGFIEASGNIAFTYRYGSVGSYSYGNQTLIFKNCTFSDFPSVYSDTFYAVFFSSPTSLSTTELSQYKSDIINSFALSSFETTNRNPSARFLNLTSEDSNFAFVDWISAGTQYPLVDFQINDNGNLNSYSLRVSTNSSYSSQIKQFHESESFKDIVYYISKGGWIANSSKQSAQMIATFVMLNECDSWVYDLSTTISSELFTFDNPDVKAKIFSLNLSDYTSILAYNMYRLEIVNNSDSRVLSTCYFIPLKNYDRTTSVYGIKSYEYGSKSDADTDSKNDSYTGTYVPGATGSNDNVSDLTFNNFSSNLSSLDISSIFGTLQTTLNSISYFFKACYSLIPASILSIVLCGLTLLVILRVLGR